VNLDWKWVGLGTLIMLALSIVAGLILGVALGAKLEGVTDPADVSLTGGQMALAALLNFLAFVIGGFIVGRKSTAKTIHEPAIRRGRSRRHRARDFPQFHRSQYARRRPSAVSGRIAGRLARRTATRDLVVGVLPLLSMGRLTRKWPFSLDCQRG